MESNTLFEFLHEIKLALNHPTFNRSGRAVEELYAHANDARRSQRRVKYYEELSRSAAVSPASTKLLRDTQKKSPIQLFNSNDPAKVGTSALPSPSSPREASFPSWTNPPRSISAWQSAAHLHGESWFPPSVLSDLEALYRSGCVFFPLDLRGIKDKGKILRVW